MSQRNISLLGYALLGLVGEKARSGYDLRKLFAETALGSFSDSPGAIYPALARLEKQALIRSEVEERAALRRRRVFRLTTRGAKQLRVWLRQAVTRDDIVRRQGDLMLRFAFLEKELGADAAIGFLKDLRQQVAGYIPELKNFLQSRQKEMPLSAMLALDSGIRSYQALLEWAQYGIRLYSRKRKQDL